MCDLRHSASSGKSGNNEEKDVFSKHKGRYKIFCFFSNKKFFHLGDFITKVKGGNNNSPLHLFRCAGGARVISKNFVQTCVVSR